MLTPQKCRRIYKNKAPIYFLSRDNFSILSLRDELNLFFTSFSDLDEPNLNPADNVIPRYIKQNFPRILPIVLVVKVRL